MCGPLRGISPAGMSQTPTPRGMEYQPSPPESPDLMGDFAELELFQFEGEEDPMPTMPPAEDSSPPKPEPHVHGGQIFMMLAQSQASQAQGTLQQAHFVPSRHSVASVARKRTRQESYRRSRSYGGLGSIDELDEISNM